MSLHYSPFHRGPDDHDPPPPYQPPSVASAPSADDWQNQTNERKESMRAGAQNAPRPHAQQSSQGSYQNNVSRQYSMTSSGAGAQGYPARQTSYVQPQASSSLPSEPPAGPFYCAPPPAGPFYPSNGSSPAPAVPVSAQPRAYPALQQQTSWQNHAQPASLQNEVQPPSGPLYPSQPPRGPLYNSDTEGVASYGATGGTTMFNAMPSRVESSSEISAGGSGGKCCNIL